MKLTLEQALQRGIAAHKAGRLHEAESLYRSILEAQPANATANHNLGVLEVFMHHSEAGLALMKRAVEVKPDIEQFWISYIEALVKFLQFETGRLALEKARNAGITGQKLDALAVQLDGTSQQRAKVQHEPDQTEINSMLASFQNGQYEKAREFALAFTARYPGHILGWKVLSAAAGLKGNLQEALRANEQAVKLDPADAESRNNLANVLRGLDRFDEAEASYRHATEIKPGYAEAHCNLGNLLHDQDRLDEAETSYRQAIRANGNYHNAIEGLGIVLQKAGRHRESLQNLRLVRGAIFFDMRKGLSFYTGLQHATN